MEAIIIGAPLLHDVPQAIHGPAERPLAGGYEAMGVTAFRVVAVLFVLAITVRAAGGADFATGAQLFEQGDYEGAIEQWQALADQGDRRAQYRLAQMYAEGVGVRKNDRTAAHWFRQAAERGSIEARYELALMYSIGRGVSRDPSRAAHWYGLLAADGHLTAQYVLAGMYETGNGVTKNLSRALWWYRQAAEQGHSAAQMKLGEAFARGNGQDKDLVQAWAWFDVAAAKIGGAAATERAKLGPLLGEEELAEAKLFSRVLRSRLDARPLVGEQAPEPEPEPQPFRATDMVRIAAGCFAMGSAASEVGRHDNEARHSVCVESYSISRYEVTRGQYADFVRDTGRETPDTCHTYGDGGWGSRSGHSWQNPGYVQGDDHPVTCVSRHDALAYAEWLSERQGTDYRLPTEAEWEYAARAGSGSARHWGESSAQACAWGNVGDQVLDRHHRDWSWQVHRCDDGHVYTAPVGSFRLNLYGLHDMLGNVWEWTCSAYDADYRGTEGRCSRDDRNGVVRGGSWSNSPRWVRAAARFENRVDARFDLVGFRLAHD